ncbi:MAG: SRPBCC domain-containing protein [Gemmatimonadales bacterium]
MKWVLIVLGVIAGLAIVLFVVGSLRPKDHIATITEHVSAPDSTVWAVVTEREKMPEWFADVKSVARIADVDGRPAFHESYGGGWTVTTVVRERVEGKKVVEEILPGGAFSGTWTYELAPDAGGTRLTITERGHVENPMFRAFMMFGDNTRTMRRYVSALKKKLGVGP